MKRFQPGKCYWIKHRGVNVWIPAIVHEDGGGDLWLMPAGQPPLEVRSLNISFFEIQDLPSPKDLEDKDLRKKVRTALAEIYRVPEESITEEEELDEADRAKEEGFEAWREWHVEAQKADDKYQEYKQKYGRAGATAQIISEVKNEPPKNSG